MRGARELQAKEYMAFYLVGKNKICIKATSWKLLGCSLALICMCKIAGLISTLSFQLHPCHHWHHSLLAALNIRLQPHTYIHAYQQARISLYHHSVSKILSWILDLWRKFTQLQFRKGKISTVSSLLKSVAIVCFVLASGCVRFLYMSKTENKRSGFYCLVWAVNCLLPPILLQSE